MTNGKRCSANNAAVAARSARSCLHELEILGAHELAKARLLQLRIVIGRQIVDADHVAPRLRQAPRDMKADKSGGAGDENGAIAAIGRSHSASARDRASTSRRARPLTPLEQSRHQRPARDDIVAVGDRENNRILQIATRRAASTRAHIPVWPSRAWPLDHAPERARPKLRARAQCQSPSNCGMFGTSLPARNCAAQSGFVEARI